MAQSQQHIDARLAAWTALQRWRADRQQFITEILDTLALADSEAGLARELALGVVRYQRLYQALIKSCLHKKNSDQALLDLLAVAAHQIFVLDRIPAHAIAHSSVELAASCGHSGWKKVVNAVVHKLLDLHAPDAAAPRIVPDALPRSAAQRYSFSDAFMNDLKQEFPKQWRSMAESLNRVVPVCTRLAPGIDETEIEHPGILRREDGFIWWQRVQDAVEQVPARGLGQIQDRSQAWLADIADFQSGERVLDYCAAPGGKTALALDAGARVFAADLQQHRLQQMQSMLPGRLFVQDGCQPAVSGAFDCVVLDVPCSNSGVFARRPEARWRYDAEHLQTLAILQRNLLHAASKLVAPDGRLIYASCSIISSENMEVCQTLAGWSVERVHLAKPNDWQAGAFAACLRREAAGK